MPSFRDQVELVMISTCCLLGWFAFAQAVFLRPWRGSEECGWRCNSASPFFRPPFSEYWPDHSRCDRRIVECTRGYHTPSSHAKRNVASFTLCSRSVGYLAARSQLWHHQISLFSLSSIYQSSPSPQHLLSRNTCMYKLQSALTALHLQSTIV